MKGGTLVKSITSKYNQLVALPAATYVTVDGMLCVGYTLASSNFLADFRRFYYWVWYGDRDRDREELVDS
jgi:hypothetical protein